MIFRSWECISVFAISLWCVALSTVGLLQFATATATHSDEDIARSLVWTQSELHLDQVTDSLAHRAKLTISPPYNLPTKVSFDASSLSVDSAFERTLPAGVEEFEIGFDLGPRSSPFLAESVEIAVNDPKSDALLVHFPARPYLASLSSNAKFLQAEVREELELQIRMQGSVPEDLLFRVELDGELKNAVNISESEIVILKDSYASSPVKLELLDPHAEGKISLQIVPPKNQNVNLNPGILDINIIPVQAPVVKASLEKTDLDEGEETILLLELANGAKEEITINLSVPLAHRSDIEISVSTVVLGPDEREVSVPLTALRDKVVWEPIEEVELSLKSSSIVDLPASTSVRIRDVSEDVTLKLSQSATSISETSGHDVATVKASLPEGFTAGKDVPIEFAVKSEDATLVGVRHTGPHDVRVSGLLGTTKKGILTIESGQQSGWIQCKAFDDKIVREIEAFQIAFSAPIGTRFAFENEESLPNKRLSFDIIDNDSELFRVVDREQLRLTEGRELPNSRLKIADVLIDLDEQMELPFIVDSKSTAIPGKDYELGIGSGKLVLAANSKTLELPIRIIDDEAAEKPKSLRLRFTDSDLGLIEIEVRDDDDSNSLKDAGEVLVLVIVNDEIVADWGDALPSFKDVLNPSAQVDLVSNSIFFVHPTANNRVWTKVSKLPNLPPALFYKAGVSLDDQLKAVVQSWLEIKSQLSGRVPAKTVVVWSNERPPISKVSKVEFEGMDSETDTLSFLWFGGVPAKTPTVQLLDEAEMGLEGKVKYLRKEGFPLLRHIQK